MWIVDIMIKCALSSSGTNQKRQSVKEALHLTIIHKRRGEELFCMNCFAFCIPQNKNDQKTTKIFLKQFVVLAAVILIVVNKTVFTRFYHFNSLEIALKNTFTHLFFCGFLRVWRNCSFTQNKNLFVWNGQHYFPSGKPPYRFSKVVSFWTAFLLIQLELELELRLGLRVRLGFGLVPQPFDTSSIFRK